MGGAGVILIINLCVAALFSGFFLLIAFYDRQCLSARWFAACFAVGQFYPFGEALVPFLGHPRLTLFLALAAYLTALGLLNIGIARLYRREPPWVALAAVFGISFAAMALSMNLPEAPVEGMFLYQIPFFLMQALGAWIVLAARPRGKVDLLLAGLLAFSAVHYLAKPVLAVTLGAAASQPQDYLSTTYAFVSQAAGTILVVATALALMAMLVGEMLRGMAIKSVTDPLSGLLNRRGFEERLEALSARCETTGLPLSLVACDLDRFKRVNDTYGHAAGDRLIEVFARVLKETGGTSLIAGRIGGEEFAILLPGSDLTTARLFAESVRSVLAGAPLEGFPPQWRFTASFGVAQRLRGEAPHSLLVRSDTALYEAKRAGRDCVRLWRPGGDGVPAHDRRREAG